jgi:hypothetical protein
VIDLVLIAVAGVLYWAWKTRDPQALRISDVMAVLAALIGLKMLNSHSPLGVLGVGGAIWWFWIRKSGKLAKPVQSMTHAEARSLLEVPISATPEEIRAAHRRLVARVHPDVGGSADLTRRVNDARDTLLRHRG